MTLEAGRQLGPYTITGSAGAGGMGEVYKARDTRLDRDVAVKALHTRVADNPDLKERFEREAKAIASLNHPNICTLYDIGSDNGADYLVMEYIEGETLSTRLSKGPLPSDELLEIAIQIADALDKAHRQGLVHRDLKPGNVMLTKNGAKLLDFGLAKFTPEAGVVMDVTSAETRTTPLTTQGAIIGTLQYMAPEQLEGVEADARSDLFSFGAMLYEMASGTPAFEGKSRASLIASVLKEQPRAVSEIQPLTPVSLELVIKQCLAKDPEQRWQSAGDLKRSLVLISEGGSVAGVIADSNAKVKQSRLPAVAAILLGALAVTFGTLWWLESSKPLMSVQTRILEPPGAQFSRWGGGSVTISPDGKRFAFLAIDTTGHSTGQLIWVRGFNSLEAQPLRGTEGANFPFWSPDSKHIAFFADDGKLKKVLATGGPTISLCEAPVGRGGSWNEDGVILFTPTMAGLIHKVQSAGGEPQVALQLDSTHDDYTHRWVHFLPDGDHFLYFARTKGEAGGEGDAICMASLSTGERKRLIRAQSSAEYSDGHIIFLRDGTLMAQPFDLGSLELSGDVFPIAEQVTYLQDWSRGVFGAHPNGTIVYRSGEMTGRAQLTVFDSSGRLLDTIGGIADQQRLSASPDEKMIAVDLNDQGAPNADIWIYNLERGIRTRLTFHDAVERWPVWSPDGRRIAYNSDRVTSQIYIKEIDGATDEMLLVEDSSTIIVPSDWSPDGQYIIYDRLGSGTEGDIYIKRVDDDSDPVPLIQSEFWESQGYVSPDGRWIAYHSNESGIDQIYVTAFPEPSGKWQVSVNGGDRARWNDDGTAIYFIDESDVIQKANVQSSGAKFTVGTVERLFAISAVRPGNLYDILNNGEKFVVNAQSKPSGVSSLVLMQNWRSKYRD